MKPIDFILLAAVALVLALAVVSLIRRKKSGKGCCGTSCAQCRGCRQRDIKQKQ